MSDLVMTPPATPNSIPTTPATPATPPPESPSSAGGIDGLMAQLDAAVLTPAAPVKSPEQKVGVPNDKANVISPTAPAETPKADDADPDWSKAPPKWHKIYEGHKAKTSDTIRGLESKIKSLESKPFEQAGDAKKLAALEKQLEELRGESTSAKQELARLDFTKSDEYKRDFVDRANNVYREAVDFVSRLQVTTEDGNSRSASSSDFDYIRSLPMDARRKAANELFGENASDVLDFTKDIDRIRRDANIAVERHSQNHERVAAERSLTEKQQREAYDGHFKTSLDAIKANEKYGKWFSENADDPEASDLLRKGFEEVEKISATIRTLPLEQQAAYGAVLRARAAATPRTILEITRLTAERDALKEELNKYRGTDPGAKGKTGAEAPKSDGPKGIMEMAAAFDSAQ